MKELAKLITELIISIRCPKLRAVHLVTMCFYGLLMNMNMISSE